MVSWWSSIGEMSLVVGCSLGLVWAFISTTRRRRKFLKAAIRPVGQLRWFTLTFFSLSSYLTLIAALGLTAHQELLPVTLFWFLLGLSAVAFASALMFPGTRQPRPMAALAEMREPPPVDPPIMPLRESA